MGKPFVLRGPAAPKLGTMPEQQPVAPTPAEVIADARKDGETLADAAHESAVADHAPAIPWPKDKPLETSGRPFKVR